MQAGGQGFESLHLHSDRNRSETDRKVRCTHLENRIHSIKHKQDRKRHQETRRRKGGIPEGGQGTSWQRPCRGPSGHASTGGTKREPRRKETYVGSSEQGRRADAQALEAEEGRDKLRKAAGRSKYPSIRGCPNGETRMRKPHAPHAQSISMRGEPGELKHLSTRRKRKKHRFRK